MISDTIVVIQRLYNLEDVKETRSKLKSSTSLLTNVRKYVGDNTHKRITLILEIWELLTNSTTISTRVFHFKEYLQKVLENEDIFIKMLWVHSQQRS
jgi:hypothetical protein